MRLPFKSKEENKDFLPQTRINAVCFQENLPGDFITKAFKIVSGISLEVYIVLTGYNF